MPCDIFGLNIVMLVGVVGIDDFSGSQVCTRGLVGIIYEFGIGWNS